MKKLMVVLTAGALFFMLPGSNVGAEETTELAQQVLELKKQNELQQKKIDELIAKFGRLEKSQQAQAQEVKSIKETAKAPSRSSGGPTAKITGTGKINFKHVGPGNNSDNSFVTEDIMLYITGKVSDDIEYFSEFLINPRAEDDAFNNPHKQTFRVERLYLTSNNIIPKHSLKVGIFQLFDGPVKDYHVGTNNPLPGDLIFFKNPWDGEENLHSIFTDVGVSIGGTKSSFGYNFSVFNGMGDRTPSGTDFDDIAPRGFFTKLLFVPSQIPGLSLAGSYYTGEKTADAAWGSKKDEYFISEIIYRWNDLELMGMYLLGSQTRQSGSSEFEHDGSGFVLQSKYNLTDKLAVIGRYQEINPDGSDSEFFGVGANNGIGDVSQFEVGLNYRLRSRLWLKLSYQMNDESGLNTAADRILGQVAFAF